MNSESIAEIRGLSRETKDKAILLRCEAVIRWLEDTPNSVVAEDLECSWSFVKKWVEKWKAHGAQSLFQKSWVGRTPIIPYEKRGELRIKILVFFQNHPEKTVTDLKHFLETQGFKIGLSSTYTLLDNLGISSAFFSSLVQIVTSQKWFKNRSRGFSVMTSTRRLARLRLWA